MVRLNPGAQREHVDAFLRSGPNGRNIDCVDKLRRGTIGDLDDRGTAVHSGVNS
jgi:hypothetical protein